MYVDLHKKDKYVHKRDKFQMQYGGMPGVAMLEKHLYAAKQD